MRDIGEVEEYKSPPPEDSMSPVTLAGLGRFVSNIFIPAASHDDFSSYAMYESCITGPIRVNEILLLIFSFLPARFQVLMSVSGVCRSWRERVDNIPQWFGLGLGHPNRRSNALARQSIRVRCELLISEAKRDQRREMIGMLALVSSYWLVLTLVLLGGLGIAWAIGREPNSSSGNDLIGVAVFFTVAIVLVVSLGGVVLPGSEYHFRSTGRRALHPNYVIIMFFGMALCMGVAIPVGLVGGRVRSLTLLRIAPVVEISCNTTVETLWRGSYQPPAFVKLRDPQYWALHAATGMVSYQGPPCGGGMSSPYPPPVVMAIANKDTSWNASSSNGYFRTPFHTAYYDGDVDGGGWYSSPYGPWHRNRRLLIHSGTSVYPSTPAEVRVITESVEGGLRVLLIVVGCVWALSPIGFSRNGSYVVASLAILIMSCAPSLIFGIVCMTQNVCMIEFPAAVSITAISGAVIMCTMVSACMQVCRQ